MEAFFSIMGYKIKVIVNTYLTIFRIPSYKLRIARYKYRNLRRSELWEIKFEFWVYTSQFWEFVEKSLNCEILRCKYKLAIIKKKSQNCENEAQNSEKKLICEM